MNRGLLCLGNLTIDDIVLPDGTTRMGCFGGDTIYGAIGASYWTNNVQFVAPIGTDFPREHLVSLHKAGWDTRGLINRKVPGIRNWIVYENDGRRTWIMRSNPADFLELSPTLEDIPKEYMHSKAGLILAMELEAQEKLVSGLGSLGILTALDPQEDYIAGNQGRILKMLAGVDIFLPSEVEVNRLLGHLDMEQAARQFADYGCKIVVIKLGAKGSLIFEKETEKFWNIPAFRTTVIDVTGAGDAYSGGFMAMYVMNGDLLKAGLAGSVSASFAIEHFGTMHMAIQDKNKAYQRMNQLSANHHS